MRDIEALLKETLDLCATTQHNKHILNAVRTHWLCDCQYKTIGCHVDFVKALNDFVRKIIGQSTNIEVSDDAVKGSLGKLCKVIEDVVINQNFRDIAKQLDQNITMLLSVDHIVEGKISIKNGVFSLTTFTYGAITCDWGDFKKAVKYESPLEEIKEDLPTLVVSDKFMDIIDDLWVNDLNNYPQELEDEYNKFVEFLKANPIGIYTNELGSREIKIEWDANRKDIPWPVFTCEITEKEDKDE